MTAFYHPFSSFNRTLLKIFGLWFYWFECFTVKLVITINIDAVIQIESMDISQSRNIIILKKCLNMMLVKWTIHVHICILVWQWLIWQSRKRWVRGFGGSGPSKHGLELERSDHHDHVKGSGGGCFIFLFISLISFTLYDRETILISSSSSFLPPLLEGHNWAWLHQNLGKPKFQGTFLSWFIYSSNSPLSTLFIFVYLHKQALNLCYANTFYR